jgi:hypothetical protein
VPPPKPIIPNEGGVSSFPPLFARGLPRPGYPIYGLAAPALRFAAVSESLSAPERMEGSTDD